MSEQHYSVWLEPKEVAKILCILVATLVLLDLTANVFRFGLGHERVLGFVPEFDLNRENNVPTYFSSLLLLVSAALLAIIASWKTKSGDKFRHHWSALAVIFIFMSVDETASLHELLNEPFGELVSAGGLLHFAWVIPALVFVSLFAVAYVNFFLHLSGRFKRLFLASAIIYVGGALGVEMIGGYIADTSDSDTVAYTIMTTTEETFELIGVSLFIYTLLCYLKTYIPEVHLKTRLPEAKKEVY